MSRSTGLVIVLTLLLALRSHAAEAPTAEQKAKAIQSMRLALDLSRAALEKQQYIDAVQLADLADRCAQAGGDAELAAKTLAITNDIRGKCPPDKVEEARKIIRELTGKDLVNKGPALENKLEAQPPRRKNTEFKLENGQLVLPAPIVFQAGGDAIEKQSEPSLFLILDFLESKPLISTLRIESHSDNTGAPEKTQALTERRALAVAKWLVARGADPKRLLPVGFGSTKPVAPNDTPQNKAANRRIEIRPAAMRGKPIGGLPVDGGGKVAEGWGK